MSLQETLLVELKALRAGTGLSEARLRDQPALVVHLGGETVADSLKKLVELVKSISDEEQQTAVNYVLGLQGEKSNQATSRRKAAQKALLVSERTLIRREIDGLTDLAQIIIEQSPKLSEQERQDERDYLSSTAKRIADLEFAVSYLARFVTGIKMRDPQSPVLGSLREDDAEFFYRTADVIFRVGGNGADSYRQLMEQGDKAMRERNSEDVFPKESKLDDEDDLDPSTLDVMPTDSKLDDDEDHIPVEDKVEEEDHIPAEDKVGEDD